MRSKLPSMTALFVVTGMKFPPDECTRHFKIKPTMVLTKGEIKLGWKNPTPESSWSVRTKPDKFDSTDVPLRLLLDLIWSKRKLIRDFSTKTKLEIEFILNMTGAGERNFLYEFSSLTIKQISYFHAPLSLDVY